MEVSDYFKRESTCLRYMEQWFWNGEPTCPRCGTKEQIWRYRDGKNFRCKDCNYMFSVKVGTVFEASKIPMRKWFMAIYLHGNMKKGISTYQMAEMLSVSQKTSWFMLHRIRQAFTVPADAPKMEGLVMCDETFVGGKNKNRHIDKKYKACEGRSFKDKTPVVGLMSGEGELRCVVVTDTKGNTLRPILAKHVKHGSMVISDEWGGYGGTKEDYEHYTVRHDKKQWVTAEGYTTNPVESAWSHFKRGIIGVYHQISKKHMQRYADDYAFRFNNRASSPFVTFNTILGNTKDKRLTYKMLVHGEENKKETARNYGQRKVG